MRDIVKASRRPRRFARATGTAASQGFRAQGRAASPVARGAPHRHATRSLPKTLGSRLYESILRTFGIRPVWTGHMRRRRFIGFGIATIVAAGTLLPEPAAGACPVFPAEGELDFLVLRRGVVIGTHRIRFAREAGRFVVRSDIEFETTPPGPPGAAPARYVHHAEEVWVGGWLHAVVSDTDDDGRRTRLRAERRDGIFQGAINGSAFTVSGYIIPSSLWHRDTRFSETLFDTVDGRLKIVRPRFIGRDRVPGPGGRVEAKHYALVGELRRELWYGLDCGLVRAAWRARDGARIVLEAR